MITDEKILGQGWTKVVMAADCVPCSMCGEPYCEKCFEHYADCECPGPHQDDIYEYEEFQGDLYARRLDGDA